MPKRNGQIRRGIYLGRTIYELARLGDKAAVRRARRELLSEPLRVRVAAIRTAEKLARKVAKFTEL